MTKKFAAGLLILCGIAAAYASGAAGAQGAEEAAVRRTLELYFRGHATGDGEYFRRAFHPESKLFAVREGKFWQLTSADYAARAAGRPAPDEAQRTRRVESVDVTGDVAVAKLVLDYPSVKFTDYMTLLKVEGEWKIINKAFHAEQKK